MVQGSTQPLIEMGSRNHPGGKGCLRLRVTPLSSSVSRFSTKFWSLKVSHTSVPSRPVARIALPFYEVLWFASIKIGFL
jgi:hypothetical protein